MNAANIVIIFRFNFSLFKHWNYSKQTMKRMWCRISLTMLFSLLLPLPQIVWYDFKIIMYTTMIVSIRWLKFTCFMRLHAMTVTHNNVIQITIFYIEYCAMWNVLITLIHSFSSPFSNSIFFFIRLITLSINQSAPIHRAFKHIFIFSHLSNTVCFLCFLFCLNDTNLLRVSVACWVFFMFRQHF